MSDEVQDRIAKTMAELATYQQGDGAFTKPYVVANAKQEHGARCLVVHLR